MTPLPPLAPPGAGIPWIERTVFGLTLPFVENLWNRPKALALFQNEADTVLDLAIPLDETNLRQPVRIPRLPGLEDSSREWSPSMVLHHLLIVNQAMLEVITALATGAEYGRIVRTADVKPSPGVGLEMIALYREGVAGFMAKAGTLPELRTRNTHPHPWFGRMNAHRWLCLAAIHQGLHRRQLQAILRTG